MARWIGRAGAAAFIRAPVVVGNNARELPAGVGGGVGGGGPGSGLLFDLHGGALVGVAALFRIGALFGVG